MQALIPFWSYALAAAMFIALLIWRVGAGATQPGHRLLLGAFAMTGCWAWLSAISAGYLRGLSLGRSLPDAARLGCATAAQVAQGLCTDHGSYTLDDVLAFTASTPIR